MKTLFVLFGLLTALPVFAGAMRQIPLRLLEVENAGKAQFLKNSVAELGLESDNSVRYSAVDTVILTGDEDENNTSGGVFHYQAVIDSSANDTFRRFTCSQQLAVGSGNERFTRAVQCVAR